MYNLHCHSLLSDGVLLPSEVAIRYAALGYKVIAIADHADYSNIETVVAAVLKFTSHWPKESPIKVLSGVELTHLPLAHFKPLAKYARKYGIKVIIGHGETTMEPVIPGTNRAALEAGIDILAHPGLITDSDVKLAKARGVFLEITSRSGHAQSNAYVVKRARRFGARLILNIDSHAPEDIISPIELMRCGRKAGLSLQEINKIYLEATKFLQKKGVRC